MSVLLRVCAVLLGVVVLATCTPETVSQSATLEASTSQADVQSPAATPDPTPVALVTPGPAVPAESSHSESAASEPLSGVTEAIDSNQAARPGSEVYRGLGAWVDVFDWAPAYAGSSGPAVTPSDLAEMAALGVSTIYFQTSRIDDTGSGVVQNEPLVVEFLARAHELDLAVVGWFLPKWEDATEDFNRLRAIADFDIAGQRFDGVAVDIEGVPTPEQRADWNLRLLTLSRQLRDQLGDRALGAIVLPPTLLEVVNPAYWPNFPWAELAPLYDVWLPMSYWSFRDDDESPFANGYDYNADATRRLRINLDDEAALVHAIGGIGAAIADEGLGEPRARVDELSDFVRSAVETSAIGISIYDWASQDATGHQTMSELVQATQIAIQITE